MKIKSNKYLIRLVNLYKVNQGLKKSLLQIKNFNVEKRNSCSYQNKRSLHIQIQMRKINKINHNQLKIQNTKMKIVVLAVVMKKYNLLKKYKK